MMIRVWITVRSGRSRLIGLCGAPVLLLRGCRLGGWGVLDSSCTCCETGCCSRGGSRTEHDDAGRRGRNSFVAVTGPCCVGHGFTP